MYSSSKAKLNRVALKDVVGLKLTPRKRRIPEPTTNTSESVISELVSCGESASASCVKAEQQRLLIKHRSENATDVQGKFPHALPESCSGTKRENYLPSLLEMGSKETWSSTIDIGSVEAAGSEEAKPANLDLHPTAVFCGGVREENPLKSCSSSNMRRCHQPAANGSAVSKKCFRRSIAASHCVTCAFCKFYSLQKKIITNQKSIRRVANAEPATTEFKSKNENTASQTPEKIFLWLNKEAKVKLCNLANKCHACSHGCSYILPDSLKTKVVRCFEKDMGVGFIFSPVCFENGKSRSKEHVCSFQAGDACEPQCQGGSDSALNQTTQHLNSLNPKKRKCQTHLTFREVEENPAPSCSATSPDFLKNKQRKLEESGDVAKLCDRTEDPIESNGTKVASESEEKPEDSETMTCQRVIPCEIQIRYSCARTDMTWPFPGRRLTHVADRADTAASAEMIHTGQNSNQSVKKKRTEKGFSHNQSSSVILPNAALDGGENQTSSKVDKPFGSTSSDPNRTRSLSSLCLETLNSIPNGHGMDMGTDTTSPPQTNGLGASSTISTCSSSKFSPSDRETTSRPNSDSFIKDASCSPPASTPSMFLPNGAKKSEIKKSFLSTETQASPPCCSFPNPPQKVFCHPIKAPSFPLTETAVAESVPSEQENDEISFERIREEMNLYRLTFQTLISPISSPQRSSSSSSTTSQSSDSEEEETDSETSAACQMLELLTPTLTITNNQPEEQPSGSSETLPGSCHPSVCGETGLDQEKNDSAQVPQHAETEKAPASDAETETRSSSGNEEQQTCDGLLSNTQEPENETPDEPASDFDEVAAYNNDILLVTVFQDDPDLFQDLPEQSALRLGPSRAPEEPKKTLTTDPQRAKAGLDLKEKPTVGILKFAGTGPISGRSWRPQCSSDSSTMQERGTDKPTRRGVSFDTNNNRLNGALESRTQPIQRETPPLRSTQLPSVETDSWTQNPDNLIDLREHKFKGYCRAFFNESQTCTYKVCRFRHLPVDGDEKFCINSVMQFTKTAVCLHKASAIFTGYYQINQPGMYFSMPALVSLLWQLFKNGMMSEIISVLSTSVTYSIVPNHDFLLEVFSLVREKRFIGFVPKLMELIFKMTSAGLELSLNCLDCIKTPVLHQALHPGSSSSKQGLLATTSNPEHLHLACAIIENELCCKLENWERMGDVFQSICQSKYHPNHVEVIAGRVAIALLSECKDKLALPFAAFAKMVILNKTSNEMVENFVGRIGVSLLLRYHKANNWAKGSKMVEILSQLKVHYTTMKSLFGNEDGVSRCHLVTVTAELLLLSGSVEGALNSLRENKWFLSSSGWPCKPTDLEFRTRVLICLAEKTSQRDTLEVLSNLPGFKEPNDSVDTSGYGSLFNKHLKVCMDKQILPVASDTLDFMLFKKLAIEESMLQAVLHKLGKQNLWHRAREVFRHSLSMGYYSCISAPPGFMTLIVPSGLKEMELALAFEMLITVNAAVIRPLPEDNNVTLSITLKRTLSEESEYLCAGSCVLAAASIPQPKLTIHYTSVNSSQEQVFKLDASSAQRWLRHNHLWANEMWGNPKRGFYL